MLEPKGFSAARPPLHGPVAQVLSAHLVSERKAEAGRVIKRWTKCLREICLRRRYEHRPVAVVAITVGDEGIEHQVAGECIECVKYSWQVGAGGYREPGQRLLDRLDVVPTLPSVFGVIVGHDFKNEGLPGLKFPIRQSRVLNQRTTDTVADSQLDWCSRYSDKARELAGKFLCHVFPDRTIALRSRRFEEPRALLRRMLEPIVRMLTLGLQAGDRPVVDADDRPRIEHDLIVPGHRMESRIDSRAPRPNWMLSTLNVCRPAGTAVDTAVRSTLLSLRQRSQQHSCSWSRFPCTTHRQPTQQTPSSEDFKSAASANWAMGARQQEGSQILASFSGKHTAVVRSAVDWLVRRVSSAAWIFADPTPHHRRRKESTAAPNQGDGHNATYSEDLRPQGP